MRFTTQLLPSRSGNLGIILLNNPKPLHALSLEMVHCFQDVLKNWYQDDSLQAILVKSSGDTKVPAFCAGGDVKQVYLDGKQQSGSHGQGHPNLGTSEFFRQEYQVNHMLATAPIPQISLWDGIVMGGGVGISIYGKYRVATERTVLAMPETAIGLFPDVGSMFWMPRMLQLSMARYLALTGARLKALDLVRFGIATHYCPSDQLGSLEADLVRSSDDSSASTLDAVLDQYHQEPTGDSTIDIELVEQVFGGTTTTVEQIVSRLQGLDDDFGAKTLAILQKMSPTSLKVTLEGLQRGRKAALIEDDLRMEFRMAQACMRPDSDFYEGIRAVLIDKDHAPQWKPSAIGQVTDAQVQSYFAPVEHEWGLPQELRTGSTSKL